jgi:DNA-binding CsgD family transcriptional regulator
MGDPAGWAAAAPLDLTGSPLQLARGSLNFGDLAMRWGSYPEARQRLATALAAAERHRYGRLRDMIRSTLVHLDWFTGDWEGLAARAVELAELVEDPVIHLDAVLVGGLVGAVTGRPDAEESLRRVVAEGRRRGIVDLPIEPSAAIARLRLAAGDVEGALAVTAEPVRVLSHKRIWSWGTDLIPVHLEGLLRSGELAAARRLLAAYARGLGEVRGRPPAARAALATGRGLLAAADGDPRRAAAAWGRAVWAWQALPRPYEALLAAGRQGDCLIAAGEREAGLARLTEVHRGLSALGATVDAERVARSLPARTWRGGRRGYGDRLSPRELEVVRLMLTGLSNPDIAQALSRSPKTVAAQLNSAMRKYRVTSRTALAVSVTLAGITPPEPEL